MAGDHPYPSGTQYEISSGAARAVVVEVGGGLREFTVDGTPVLDGYPAGEMCVGARGQLLVPWPNRLAGGSYEFDGESLQLPLTEPGNGTAIHGLVRWANFTCSAREPDAVTMSHRLHPQPGWPFHLDLEVRYRVSDRGLTVQAVARNPGARPCPYGNGAHPYLRAGSGRIDDAVLHAPAARYYPVDEQKIPEASEPVDGTDYDFRSPRSLAGVVLDTAYTDLHRDDDGRFRVRLSGPGTSLVLWLGGSYRYLELFTGDSLPDPRYRRTGLGVEPMTCAPNAYRSGDGLIRLEPGAEHRSEWGIDVG